MELKWIVAVLLLFLFGIGVVYAVRWQPENSGGFRMRNETQWNRTDCRYEWSGEVRMFNETAFQQFIQAISENDYETAMELHREYGFGGRLFDKLNETTFAKYSKIYTLNMELMEELGMKGRPGKLPLAGKFARGRFQGAGWHGCATANETTTS
ncbi:MAG: hypothetical protein QXF56_00120 [Candidatus Micrarchaeia archaeon]